MQSLRSHRQTALLPAHQINLPGQVRHGQPAPHHALQTYNPLQVPAAPGGSVQQGLSAAGASRALLTLRLAADKHYSLGVMNMRHLSRAATWLIVAAVAIWSLLYFVQHFQSTGFQEGAMGNLFATILGVVVGIPIALEISRRQQDSQSAAAQAERQAEETKRKRKILSLLRTELEDNRSDLVAKRKPIDNGGKREVHTISLRDEMWAAFSDGGELQHVNNPDVLAAIANAYYQVRSSIHLERSFINALHFPGIRMAQKKYPQDYFLDYLTSTDPQVLAAIAQAIAVIDAELASASPAK